ncbi:hypothetical protein BHM03_00039704, partial [Ensete ventricosum]
LTIPDGEKMRSHSVAAKLDRAPVLKSRRKVLDHPPTFSDAPAALGWRCHPSSHGTAWVDGEGEDDDAATELAPCKTEVVRQYVSADLQPSIPRRSQESRICDSKREQTSMDGIHGRERRVVLSYREIRAKPW